ncbi:hypothetical protein BN1723_017518, partial [Verticillium longisporum]
MSIEHADFDGIERLALVTGGEITSTFDHPEQVQLGHCDLIEEVIIGEDTLIKFSGVGAGEACTIVLRGATDQLLDEAERSLHDALAVLSQTVKEPRTTLGGGCAEMVMAKAVEGAATRVEGKKQMAIIKKAGGKLSDSYLDEGFILDKKIGVNQPKRLENAKILVANTSMDTDKVKIFGARVKVGSTSKLAELEKAEKD